MQMYPRDHRGYVEEQHYSEIYEESVYKDDYYNGGSPMHAMKPNYQPLPKHGHNQNHSHVYGGGGYNEEQHYSEIYEESVYKDDYYNGGSPMHVMKPNYQPLPKHGHNQNHSHVYGGGGYNERGRNGHENHVEQHYEPWHEGNWRRDGWGKNDHSAHGGKNHYNGEYPHREEVKYGGHGAHQGHFSPHKEFGQHHEDKKRAPVWLSRGNIED